MADSLRNADKKVAAIDYEIKKVTLMLKAKADADRRKEEREKIQRVRDAEAEERAGIAVMKSEINDLRRMVRLLSEEITSMKGRAAKEKSEARKKQWLRSFPRASF